MFDDFDAIEQSFAKQYPQKDLYANDMDYKEFIVLLSGLDETTPLGKLVIIRSEEDPEVIKTFTKVQKRIRDDYRNKKMRKEVSVMTDEERKMRARELYNDFVQKFK
jgi:hypothetical protein